jgi:hypothetical protein
MILKRFFSKSAYMQIIGLYFRLDARLNSSSPLIDNSAKRRKPQKMSDEMVSLLSSSMM